MPDFSSSETTELAKALINVQRNLQPAAKDADNPFTKSRYATLNSVMDSCRDALLSNGIWLCQFPVPAEPGHLGLMTKLTHAESGQWQSSLAVVPLSKADPQGMGIAMTYMRRYALSAMLAIVTEEDTDGEASKTPTPRKTATNAPQSQKALSERKLGEPILPALNRTPEALSLLPKLDGIVYSVVTAQDGQDCIVAAGNTAPKKTLLMAAGFLWNAQRKMWWRYATVS